MIDLGLARFESWPSQVENITTYRQLLGSLDYIAPEQCEDSHSVDIRADIYSLGCTMYELLAGRAPFAAAGSMLMKIRAHGAESARPIRSAGLMYPSSWPIPWSACWPKTAMIVSPSPRRLRPPCCLLDPGRILHDCCKKFSGAAQPRSSGPALRGAGPNRHYLKQCS